MLQKKKKLDECNTINCVYVFWFKLLFLKMTCSLWCLHQRSGCRDPAPYVTSHPRQLTAVARLQSCCVWSACCPSLPNRRCPAHVFCTHVAADPFTTLSATSESCPRLTLFSPHFFWGGEIPNSPLWRRVVSITEVLRCCFVDGSSLLGSRRRLRLFDCETHNETPRELKHNSLLQWKKVRL